MRTAAVVTVIALATSSLAACGARQQAGEYAQLRVRVVPDSAAVYVDDRFIASGRKLASRPERMRPGEHFITVSAPGYFPHDVQVDLPVGETTIELRLRPVPP